MNLTGSDIIVLVFVGLALIIAGLYFLNKWTSKKVTEQQSMIEKSKTLVTIYVIDKKKDKLENANLPKVVTEQMPKLYKFMKMPLVKAKIGPQIMTLMCDKRVFEALPVNKNAAVYLAGIYIVDMKGLKSKHELKEMEKARKAKQKGSKGNILDATKNKLSSLTKGIKKS